MLRIGDVVEIPLSDQRKAYAQYIIRDRMGPIIQVFKYIHIMRPELDLILNSGALFPPVITGLSAAVKTGFWKKIGSKRSRIFVIRGMYQRYMIKKQGKPRSGITGTVRNPSASDLTCRKNIRPKNT